MVTFSDKKTEREWGGQKGGVGVGKENEKQGRALVGEMINNVI